ncbi:hypothetical protein BKA70DRAFT_1351657 [Coprinopsis sp. MPI-PUGE-AT-0042]|nr:hypothetical protein BKA70DRAFT_1351657 [Coprinopsis sp. MPI-PUGE-AT-0042]
MASKPVLSRSQHPNEFHPPKAALEEDEDRRKAEELRSERASKSLDLFKPPALSLWMRALQRSRVQRMPARASRLHLHPSAVIPQQVAGCIEQWYSVLRHCRRSFGGPAPFLQGTLEALLPSGATSAAIPPNHSLDGIKGTGSLTSPSHIHPRQRRTLERRTGPNRTCIYPLVSITNRSLFEGLNPSLSFTSAIPADPRF